MNSMLTTKYHKAASTIQRKIRRHLRPKIRACVVIQCFIRGFLSRLRIRKNTERIRCAKLIQKVVRGVLVRISDNHILSQIYIKLPPFWRDVLNSAPAKSSRLKIDLAQIHQLKEQAGDVVAHIVHDIAKDGIVPSKLPIYIPQPFDDNPYVSLSDGSKLAYYSDQPSLLNRNSSSVHTFNVQFWPLTRPAKIIESDTGLYDRSIDGFDVKQSKSSLLVCVLCSSKMRAVWCKYCNRGFCFVCAFRYRIPLSVNRYYNNPWYSSISTSNTRMAVCSNIHINKNIFLQNSQWANTQTAQYGAHKAQKTCSRTFSVTESLRWCCRERSVRSQVRKQNIYIHYKVNNLPLSSQLDTLWSIYEVPLRFGVFKKKESWPKKWSASKN